MLTVLIETKNDQEGLALTLGSLIGGAIEGVVREVIVCDRGSTDHTHRVADHAGCGYVANGGISAGIRQAKGEWLLVMEPGARLVDGWMEGVLHHISHNTMPARFSRSKVDRAPFLSRVFSSNRALSDGLVIIKGQAVALSRHISDAEALARGLASKRLRSEIRVAGLRR